MSSSSSTKACFNYSCKQVVERPRKGWRRRTGEFAELCDRCASAYEDGKFCESFHMNASGWRCCESCGKQIHCGCIVSFHMFVLLDAGGIECMSCARKSFILTPNPAWPPPSLTLPVHPERIRDISAKNWTPSTGSGQAPWRQSHNFLNSGAIVQSELQRRLPSEVEKLGSVERPLSFASIEKKKDDPFERSMNGNLKIVESRTIENGIAGIMREEPLKSCVNFPQQSLFSKNDLPTPQLTSNASSALRNETIDKNKIIGTNAQKSIPLPLAGKQLCSQNGVDSAAGEAQTRNPKPRDARGRGQLLPRYWPRVTDQELQQISGDLNSVITPLFEKMLSASDAGRIGRLVLPKKCAEAYFPPISSSEGLPLKVQDLKGKEWVFQFRFWPNNNSRMYVLEGVTPCIQSMQLQAGDIVTFSRVEPEGKLVMGCRKISTSPPDQAANSADAVNTLSESEKKGQIVKENSGVGKRKNSILGSKSKRIRVENEGTLELNVTFAQAQELLRSSPNNVPTIVVIEGIEIEEYEDAPIIGRPSIFATEHTGGEIQWAQCESCFKWRKVPASALLPAQWTCSANTWDPERSACSAAQELRSEQLQDLLPNLLSTNKPSKKTKTAKDDPDSTELDALANLAIQDGEEASMPSSSSSPLAATTTSAITTTKHPRHRPGCSCIVCIQPPSGKGPKHKQSCMCNVCETVKRRFRTQMINRVKKQSEMLGGQNRKESFGSPFKGNFDLNIRPEREEELSPGSDSGSPPTRLLTNGTETCVAQRRCSSLLANPDENGGNCQGATAEHRANALASTSATR